MLTKTYQWGDCSVLDGELGKWKINTFTVKSAKDDLYKFMADFRAIRDGNADMIVPAGTYRRLLRKDASGWTVVMSNTPMERNTNYQARQSATGRVLINGLGMGMVLDGMLNKSEVEYVRVIEKDAELIKLVGAHYAGNSRIEIVHADAFEYTPAKGERFGYVWHDIWDDISEKNLPQMATLNRKYSRFTKLQGTWSRERVRKMQRRSY